jgi:hypothetical protein
MDELARLESSVLGLPSKVEVDRKRAWNDEIARIDASATIDRQLEILRRMYETTGIVHVRDNFAYIAHRALHVIRQLSAEAFGHPRLFTPFELFQQLFPDHR